MLKAHYFYFHLKLKELEKLVQEFQKDFQTLLEDNFTDDELAQFEDQLDSIAAVYVQPMIEELSFDDLNPDLTKEMKQREFFEKSLSSICMEDLPFFETNPFQVTYLEMLLKNVDDFLVDRGGQYELMFKESFLSELKKYKKIDLSLNISKPLVVVKKINKPISPIDFVMRDIYQELERLKRESKMEILLEKTNDLNENARKILNLIIQEELDSETLFIKSKLNPKTFDDNLEKVKFFLKKIC